MLNFHGIGLPGPAVPEDERAYWCPEAEWPALLDAVARVRDRGATVAVTFDDGNASDVGIALPALAARGLRATFHPCAGRLGSTGYVDAEALGTLRAAGMEVGSHGWGHVDLRRLDAAGLAREAEESRRVLAEASGGPIEAFAVPFGSYDRRVLAALGGYRRVYTSDRDRARASAWLQPRFSYTTDWTPDTVVALATGRVSVRTRVARSIGRGLKRLR